MKIRPLGNRNENMQEFVYIGYTKLKWNIYFIHFINILNIYAIIIIIIIIIKHESC